MNIIILLLLPLLCFANFIGGDLKKPNSTAFDFTFQSPQNKIQETLSDMILIEISKQTLLERRQENLWQCQTDQFGTTYCPTGLESAKSYTAYSPSTSLEREDTVIDYEQGTYAEKTSVVRDFMDGFATTRTSSVVDYQSGSGTSNVGTVIDYQNGSAVAKSGSVVDYTNKETSTIYTNKTSTTETVPLDAVQIITGSRAGSYAQWNSTSTANKRAYVMWVAGGNGPECWNGWKPWEDFSKYDKDIYKDRDNYYHQVDNSRCEYYLGTYNIYGIKYICPPSAQDWDWEVDESAGNCKRVVVVCPQGYTETTGAEVSKGECKKNVTICPAGYTDNGTNCQKSVSFDFYQYTCPSTYSPINSGFTSYTKTDPNTSTQNWNSLDDAVNSATPPAGNCQKTITYSYYKYNCPTGYTVRDGGLTSACPRTDPDKAINNESTLSQPCNNATPPAGNCEKVIPYTFYSYECSAGYTAIDKGLATCTKTDSSTSTNTSSTLSQPCNSATPPKENCYKDISYKHYTYGCSPGYITDNYGLATCPKTDPNRNVNNSATLDDDCNSKTPPEGNCRRSYSYKYYEYLCQGKNSFLESYKTLNKGLASCTKTDTNKNTVNSELANACNSSTPPANNCQSTEYACDSALFEPVYVGGKWVCSPYLCNDDMKCGYGTCDLPTTPSATKYQDIAYNPLGTVNNNKCNGDICDFVVNARVTYCETKQCPKGDDIIEKNGKCYKLECPAGTYLSGEKCIKVN